MYSSWQVLYSSANWAHRTSWWIHNISSYIAAICWMVSTINKTRCSFSLLRHCLSWYLCTWRDKVHNRLVSKWFISALNFSEKYASLSGIVEEKYRTCVPAVDYSNVCQSKGCMFGHIILWFRHRWWELVLWKEFIETVYIQKLKKAAYSISRTSQYFLLP